MKNLPYDYAAEINRDRRRHAFMKLLARGAVGGLAAILGIAFGALVSALHGHPASLVCTVLLVVWGAWGFYFLTTRH